MLLTPEIDLFPLFSTGVKWVSGLSFPEKMRSSGMNKTRYTEEQIAFSLKQVETRGGRIPAGGVPHRS
ncbi:putative transposase [Erwinia piriflorinigrans CFBP 5888]|uniref:Putative transposase n=1 Tax=Erwinia piriflorinigrans CFBP 5888 TaxID=1161919 RepID=V5Z4C0_9GAMM|nr:putative transposase [Erwinia piriflorinigrans CFBP 5888]